MSEFREVGKIQNGSKQLSCLEQGARRGRGSRSNCKTPRGVDMAYTVGSYLAARLSEIGLKHHFAVAGDYNLVLLDELLTNKELKQVYCSNELNCGFFPNEQSWIHDRSQNP